MLAVGFIPDRNDVQTLLGGQYECPELCLGLPRKTVSDTKRKFLQFQ